MTYKNLPPAWGTSCDEYGDPDENLVLNRNGASYLKQKIEEALAKGEAEIGDEARFGFITIKISEKHPCDHQLPTQVKRVIGRFTKLSIGLLCFGFMIFGFYSFIERLMK